MTVPEQPTDADVIVVGGGAAGCVLAARLSEDPDRTVVLLEVGGPDAAQELHVPGMAATLGASEHVNADTTVPQAALGGRGVPLVTGRVLGGGSSVNAMWWFAGQPGDYDRWAAQGAVGWGYDDLAPLLRGIEDHALGAGPHHGADGPMTITSPHYLHPLGAAFAQAGDELGWPVSGDLNGAQREGVGLPYSNIRDGARHSVVDGYLRAAQERGNLTVVTGARVEQVLVDGGTARGVRWTPTAGGPSRELTARRAVVLSAGAVRTPQLLMLSGIGPAGHLREHDVSVLVDSPGVGSDLQDHPVVPLLWSLPDGPAGRSAYTDPEQTYRLLRRGPLSSIGHAVAALRLTDVDAAAGPGPDTHLCLTTLGSDAGTAGPPGPAVYCHAAVLTPRSRGTVRLADADAATRPAVDPRYLDDPRDRQHMRQAVRTMGSFFSAPSMAALVGAPMFETDLDDDAALDALITENASTYHHPVGTARLGTDAEAVVGLRLDVHGVDRLFVVDASVMPVIPRGNPQATTIAIAERAATLLQADLGAVSTGR